MENALASIAELDGHFELTRGEHLHVCYDRQPKMAVVPIFPAISRLMNEETSK